MTTSRPLLFDAHHLGHGQTGNETWTRNIAIAMRDLGAEPELQFAVTREGETVLRRYTAAPAHLVSGRSSRRLLVDVPRLVRAIKARAVLVTYTAPVTTCPTVVAVHDVSPWHRQSRPWFPPATRARHQVTVGLSAVRANRVIVPSEATKADIVHRLHIPARRVVVAPCAVDLELVRLLQAAPARLPDGRFRILAVGTVVLRKNLALLARAVRAARDAGVPVELRIVGPVSEAGGAIVADIQGLLGDDVHITGYVTESQLASEYKAADVVCFPSLFEGFGMPIVEAMAAGVPVMVSDALASQEVTGGGAVVCDAHDVRVWRDGLVRLWNDPARREALRQDGRRRAARFSWHDSARLVLDALHEAAGMGPVSLPTQP